jgi:hypothetical protein
MEKETAQRRGTRTDIQANLGKNMLDSSAQVCHDGSRRVWSLLDLLSMRATHYVNIGAMYEDFINGRRTWGANPEALPNDPQYAEVLTLFTDLRGLCGYARMTVSTMVLDRILVEFRAQRPKHGLVKDRMEQWYICFTSELESQLLLIVLPHRHGYYNDQDVTGVEIGNILKSLQVFPGAAFDAREAGNCFAFERFTACVYHLMRVAEFGLVSVARSINVSEERISKGWDGCVQGVQGAIKTIESTKPTTDWQERVKKYSDLCSWFTTIKTGWRNPVSHVPRIYSEGTASGMFSAVKTLFDHLGAQGFKETEMPAEPMPLPEN